MAVGSTYVLRDKQEEAVRMTLDYHANRSARRARRKFLWNAKPRFGKTLTTYDLIRRMKQKAGRPIHVLIVTNRPSIANSWYEDFERYIGWQTGFRFVSDNDALRDKPHVMTRQQFVKWISTPGALDGFDGQICFESLQGLKGSVYFGGNFNKLEWMSKLKWDLLVIDESPRGCGHQAHRPRLRQHPAALHPPPLGHALQGHCRGAVCPGANLQLELCRGAGGQGVVGQPGPQPL